MERAVESDLPEMIAFLGQQPHRAMFPLSNLLNFGLDGEGIYGTSCWLRRSNGQITDVMSITNSGVVLPFCPTGPMLEPLRGREVGMVIGPAEQCRPLIKAAGLNWPTRVDHDEPHFLLDLKELRRKEGRGQIIPLSKAPKDILLGWMAGYEVEALGLDPASAGPEAAVSYERYIAAGDCVVLMDGDRPLAMANLNARLPEIVQVGGVYTPSDQRGQGHAQRVVSLLLEQARNEGARKATLFAASEIAARAYISIGFERIGDWTICMFKERHHV